MIQIKRNNKVFFTLEDSGEGSKLSYQLMDHHYIILKFTTATPIYFEIGDSVEIPDFGYFELTSAYFPKHNGSDGYDYEMQMDAYYMAWKNKLCKYRPQHGANETSFKLTTTVGVHMNVILGNLKALGLTYNGKEFSVDYTTYNNKAFDVQKRFLIEYGSISILDALNSICSEDALNCEWWIDGSIIYLGYCEMEGQATFEQDVNVLSMSYSESKSTYITRLYAFGSDRNIPKGYFTGADADVTTDGVATDYLMLPNKEVDSDGFYAKDGYLENVNVVKSDKQAIEGVVMFEEEYPKVESVVSSIKTYDSTVDNEDGTKTTQTFWQVTSTDSFTNNFKESWIKSNLTLGIKFTSGALMGMEFDVSFKVIDKVNYFEIVANDTYGRTLPDGVMCPKVGDKYFLFNWDATKITDTDLIPTAQLSLFDRSKQYYQKTMISNSNFTCTMDGDKFYNDGIYDYHPLGEQVKLINDMFAQVDADGKHYRNSRIIGMEIPLDIPYDHPQYIVGEKAATSRLGKLEDKVDSIKVNGMQIGGTGSGNGGGVYVIGLNDTTPASDSNVYSARRSRMEFIHRLTDDTAKGTVTWEKVQKLLKGLDIGDNKGAWSADGTLSLFRLLTNNFSSGPYGQGAQIDEKGDMEVNSIYARQFISAPKFVFNEISVTKAEQWNTNGYGTIESVDVENRTITLHLEENDYGSLQVGDICRGLYADIDNAHGADKIEEGALDDCNFVQHKGFFTTYFYVTHIITNEKGKFVFQYGKKSSVTPDPCAYMDFAQYGSFTDEKRQSSMYFSSRGNSYIEVLDGVKTWEVQSQNRVARYGWLGGLALVKKDGSIVRPEGNGIYVQDNIYFGGNINYLQGLSGLDDLREEAKAYDVSLSQYQSVITVDDMGNVINGLYTEDEEKTTKQYRISTAVFVRKGMDILLEEDGNTEDVTAGHYRVHAVSEDCEVMVQNSTIFVTAIRNIKDGVAGTKDDATFDYDAMRKATDAMVTIVVELEGKTSKTVQMPIRIQHDTLPFMVCDLSNESASVAWNTKTAKYIGFPIKTKVSLMYHNEPWAISSLNISKVAGLKTSMSIEGKAKVITIDADNLTADTLAQVTKMNITVVGRYAGANYEYTRELTILKSSDTVVYELIPSADSIVVDKDGNTTVNSVSCDVYATSSDDKRYKLPALPSGMTLKYGKSENATTSVGLGTAVSVSASDKIVTFALYDKNNQMLDKESVPVLAFGKDGKGIEYIFKLQNTAPSNPTPSDYATNTEYQRTDQEFVPDGWTDDPTGVNAVNLYEWVSKRVSVNGHWGAFSDPAEYAHFGKHAPKAKSSDDIVTIPTDSNGNALLAFREEVGFSLLVDGHECNISSIQRYSSTLSHVSCSISGNVATITCEEGAALGITSQTVVFKVTGTLDGSSYSDYVTVKVVPNVTGSDGDGYEYIYYQSNYLNNDFSAPKRTNGKLTEGWQDDLMAPTKDKRYVFVAYKRGELGSDGEFSMPQLFNRYPRSIVRQETKFIAWHSLTDAPDANEIWYHGSTDMPTDFSDDKPWLWKVVRTIYTEGDLEYTVSCEGYKAKDGDGLIVGYQSSASEPSVLPTPKTLADYDKAQDDIGSGWTKTAPATGGKSIVLGGKITTDEIIDRYNSSTSAWGTEESEILLDGIKQKKTFYKTPSSLGNNGKCIRRIKVVNHFRDSYLRVMMKSYSETNWDLVCISRLYLPSEVINSDGNQIKEDSEYLNRSEYAYVVSGNGQSLVAELSMPDAGEYYFFIGYFKDGGTDSYGDYGLFAWQSMIALTESLWRTDGTVDAVGNITWSKAMPMQAEAIVMERAYIATTNDTSVPAKPYRTNGILQGGWTAKRLAVSSTNRFIWESVRAGKHGTDSVQDDWSQPVVVANFAEAGKMGKNGCIVRNSEGWKSGATYHNDSALTKEQKYIDLIYIEDNNANDGWSIYQCNVTHTATGSSFDPSAVDSDKNKLWTKLSDAGPMYSPLIVAKNAVLKFAQGQQFNLMEGNNIFGSFRWVKDDADYAFWIGGTEGSNATTSITRGGKLIAKDAVITGTITATSGKIGGLGITEKGLSIGTYGESGQYIGTVLEHSSFWSGYFNNVYGEVCVGKAALINPFTNRQQTACDMYGYSSLNVQNATMIVRKITKGLNMNAVNDPFHAALSVDTDQCIGIRSIGGNLLGSIAQNVIRTNSVTPKEQTAIDNNRVGIIVMTNSSTVDVKLPKNPMTGQMLIVVQGNSRVNFDPVVSDRKVYCSGDLYTLPNKFNSRTVGQFNIFVWDGYVWQVHYINN